MILRIHRDSGGVEGIRSEVSELPVSAVIFRLEHSLRADKGAHVHVVWRLRIEADSAWSSGNQTVDAAIAPMAPAILRHQQPTVVGGQEHMFGITRIDRNRVTVLAGAALQLPPRQPVPSPLLLA